MLKGSKGSIGFILALLVALCIFAVTVTAQNEKKALTVTGCLQKGDEANEFAITGTDGKNYELVSSSVKLSEHVGHKVSVTGTAIGEKNEADEKREQGEGWSGKLKVSSLKMVSESCK